MAEIDDELARRSARFCRDSGHPAPLEEVRAALAPLRWDELLALRGLLEGEPFATPLSPRALAELVRGRPPSEAAPGAIPPAPAGPKEELRPGPRRRAAGPKGPRIRRRREQAPAVAPPAEPAPSLDLLLAEEGRTVLERLLREHGARRGRIAAALAKSYRRADGGVPDEGDLERLLLHHGLARAFEHRERDELLYALRAAGGQRPAAAAALGLSPEAFEAAARRRGVLPEVEAIRATHREELRRRLTLSERVRLLLDEEEPLRDLDLLEEVEGDLRQRLPEHLRALRASAAEPLGMALARSLAIPPRAVEGLALRLGLDLGRPLPGGARPLPSASPRGAPRSRTRGEGRGPSGPRRPRNSRRAR